MKRTLIVAAGMVVAVVGVVTGTALCLSRCLSVSFECRVDFLYEFDRPFKDVPGRGTLNADESNRNSRYESILDDFRRDMLFCASKDGIIRCQRDSAFQGEPDSRITAVLSSVRLDVTGMPSTNFVYPCRLVLSDGDRRALDVYARFCMDKVKEQLEEEIWDCGLYRAKAKNLLVVPSEPFGVEGYFRLGYCVSKEMIERALPVFREVFEEL